MRDCGERPRGSRNRVQEGDVIRLERDAARHADTDERDVGRVGLSYCVQVKATVAVLLGRRRPGRQLLQPVVEKRPAIRPPRRAAELRTVNRIGQQLAGRHVENPHDAVLRAGRRGAIGDVAAIPRRGVVVERPVRAACLLQPLGIDEQALGCAEAVAHIELVDLFAGEPLEIEQALPTKIWRADRRIGIRERVNPRRQVGVAGNRGEEMTGVVILRVQPSEDSAVLHVLEPTIGIRDDGAKDGVVDDTDGRRRRTSRIGLREYGDWDQRGETGEHGSTHRAPTNFQGG